MESDTKTTLRKLLSGFLTTTDQLRLVCSDIGLDPASINPERTSAEAVWMDILDEVERQGTVRVLRLLDVCEERAPALKEDKTWKKVAKGLRPEQEHFGRKRGGPGKADRPEARRVPQAAPAPPFRVLLLSTEPDLGEKRRGLAGHLRTILGIDVTETADIGDGLSPETFDLVILLQGWRWDGGKVAGMWEVAPEDRRLVFLGGKGLEGSPFDILEAEAYSEVLAFRQSLTEAVPFESSQELPSAIAKAVSERRHHEDRDARPLGLTDLECAYLNLRLPFWQAGRTGGCCVERARETTTPRHGDRANVTSRLPHEPCPSGPVPGETVDGSEVRVFYSVNEVYDDRLYVPLDGTSSGWHLDDSGTLTRIDPESGRKGGRRRAGDEGPHAMEAGPLRLPLGRWASSPPLTRIALVGPPGAGKTVFLTRLAAALGAVLLGRARAESLEAFVCLDGLRSGPEQRLPVPVVLEASRLAATNRSGISALLEAVADELAEASPSLRPDPGALEEELRAGRYLLLVDALDEISSYQQRRDTLLLLKGLAGACKSTRLLLTTRSARYTGEMAFLPELEIVQTAPLNADQVSGLCHRFSERMKRGGDFAERLTRAVQGMESRLPPGEGEEGLTANPLLLTGICMVFGSYGRLPDDRADLCELVVKDLCRVRRSEDLARRWRLLPEDKEELLKRLALSFQEENAQRVPVEEAMNVIGQALPPEEARERSRLYRYLQWLADHTGLLYFVHEEAEGEQVRFWHRLFREYLAAARLTSGAQSVETLLEDLWRSGRLVDPFWEDVVRLLPRALGSPDRVVAMSGVLRRLSREHPEKRGRLLGLLAAAVVESRGLFKQLSVPELVEELIGSYESEGGNWPVLDRLLLLRSVGSLGDDPRLGMEKPERWVWFPPGEFVMGDDEQGHPDEKPAHRVKLTKGFWLGRYLVTNQEYRTFIEDGGYDNEAWWSDEGWWWRNLDGKEIDKYVAEIKRIADYYEADWFKPSSEPEFWSNDQFNASNQPVVGVSWYEAEAYCNWLTERIQEGRLGTLKALLRARGIEDFAAVRVMLPTEAQWEFAARGTDGTKYPWGNDEPTAELANYDEGKVGRTTPVGAYPRGVGPREVHDLAGNVWEWCRDIYEADAYKARKGSAAKDPLVDPQSDKRQFLFRALRGGGWAYRAGDLRSARRDRSLAGDRNRDRGFRCLLCPEHGR